MHVSHASPAVVGLFAHVSVAHSVAHAAGDVHRHESSACV